MVTKKQTVIDPSPEIQFLILLKSVARYEKCELPSLSFKMLEQKDFKRFSNLYANDERLTYINL